MIWRKRLIGAISESKVSFEICYSTAWNRHYSGAISFWQKLFVLHLLTVASRLLLVGSKGELIEVFGKWSLTKRWGDELIYKMASSQIVSLVSWWKCICAASLLIGNDNEDSIFAFRLILKSLNHLNNKCQIKFETITD